MDTRYQVDKEKVLYADECFVITGMCFYVQNKLGRFAKEKQFCDSFEERAKEVGMPCRRELVATATGNRIDFVLFDRILLEIKAKPFLNQDDFAQVQRYLRVLDLQLGLLQDLRIEPSSRHFTRIFGGVVLLRREKPQENNEEIGQSRFLGSGSARLKKRRCVSPVLVNFWAKSALPHRLLRRDS